MGTAERKIGVPDRILAARIGANARFAQCVADSARSADAEACNPGVRPIRFDPGSAETRVLTGIASDLRIRTGSGNHDTGRVEAGADGRAIARRASWR